jgi:hypothetical protein
MQVLRFVIDYANRYFHKPKLLLKDHLWQQKCSDPAGPAITQMRYFHRRPLIPRPAGWTADLPIDHSFTSLASNVSFPIEPINRHSPSWRRSSLAYSVSFAHIG